MKKIISILLIVTMLLSMFVFVIPASATTTTVTNNGDGTITVTTKDEDGNVLKWSEVLKDSAISVAQQTVGFYNEAVAAGITLTEDQQAEIDETVENYRTQAAENNYSLNAFLRTYFGAGFNEKTFVKQLEMELLAQNFSEAKQTEVNDGITDEVVSAEYKEYKKNYITHQDIVNGGKLVFKMKP